MQGSETRALSVEEYSLSDQKDFPVLGKRVSSKYDTQTLDHYE